MLIINPVSGKMKSKSSLYDILDSLYRLPDGTPDPGRRVTVVPTTCRGDASRLSALACEEGYDRIVCAGGDGTLNEVINGLMQLPAEKRIPLGYIPSGSTNDFASSMGLSSVPKTAAAAAGGNTGECLDIGHFVPVDAGDGIAPRYFSYIASFGAFTEASYSTKQSAKNVMGHMAYLLEGITDIGNIVPRHVRIELGDGTISEGDFLFGAVTNTTSAGGVVRLPADEVSLSDGELEVFMIRNPKNLTELGKIITSLLASDYTGNNLIDFYHTERVRFILDTPLAWSLDGEEAVCGTRVDVICHKGAILLKK